jgi:hypothetical protein
VLDLESAQECGHEYEVEEEQRPENREIKELK